MKVSPGMIRMGLSSFKTDEEMRDTLRVVFREMTSRQLAIVADALLAVRREQGL